MYAVHLLNNKFFASGHTNGTMETYCQIQYIAHECHEKNNGSKEERNDCSMFLFGIFKSVRRSANYDDRPEAARTYRAQQSMVVDRRRKSSWSRLTVVVTGLSSLRELIIVPVLVVNVVITICGELINKRKDLSELSCQIDPHSFPTCRAAGYSHQKDSLYSNGLHVNRSCRMPA
jgi:hypothetical protein